MAHALTNQARSERNAAVRADRARGFTYRKLAAWHGLSVGCVHVLAADVHIHLLSQWHRARLPKLAPLPSMPQAHRVMIVGNCPSDIE
jgi:hypothetical protein